MTNQQIQIHMLTNLRSSNNDNSINGNGNGNIENITKTNEREPIIIVVGQEQVRLVLQPVVSLWVLAFLALFYRHKDRIAGVTAAAVCTRFEIKGSISYR